jgi:hypothetical protein
MFLTSSVLLSLMFQCTRHHTLSYDDASNDIPPENTATNSSWHWLPQAKDSLPMLSLILVLVLIVKVLIEFLRLKVRADELKFHADRAFLQDATINDLAIRLRELREDQKARNTMIARAIDAKIEHLAIDKKIAYDRALQALQNHDKMDSSTR